MDEQLLDKTEEILGYSFQDRELLHLALTHASLADDRLESNERLEFLGDAILGMIVCEYLFKNFPDLLEGEMTKIKSSVVSRNICAKIAQQTGLDELVRLGKGLSSRSALPPSVAAAVYESLIGALYLDAGLDVVKQFVLRDLEPKIISAADSGHQQNFKSVLQQMAQQEFGSTPQYLVLDEKGPDHAKCFEVGVAIGTRRFQSSWGPSKKHAEQSAALSALVELGHAERTDNGEVRLTATSTNNTPDEAK